MTIHETAQKLLESNSVCNFCLGRPFANLSFGLGNDERGRAVRITQALESDEPYSEPPASACWVCMGITGRYDELATQTISELIGTELATYQVGSRVPPLIEENERLFRDEAAVDPDVGENLHTEVNREVGRRIGARLGIEVDFTRPDVQILLDLDEDEIHIQRNSIAIYGRYQKLKRHIPQTAWDMYDESVEELISPPFLSAFRGTEAVFHGAGREDVDALMLGSGRPFVLEIKNPRRRQADLEELRQQVQETNGEKVDISELTAVSYEMIERVKELDASKTYRVTVSFEEEVDEARLTDALNRLEGATIEQRTPHRVDHRRADKVRTRRVLAINGSFENDRNAEIDIHGEGGLYIKELMHGDEGRTQPSLAAELGIDVNVVSLDVIKVDGRDEPFLTDKYRCPDDYSPIKVTQTHLTAD